MRDSTRVQSHGSPEQGDSLALLRRVLLALVLFGAAGLGAELLLLDHFESWEQWIPLVLLALAVGAGVVVAWRQSPATVRFFQTMMVLCVVAGLVGVFLHYRGNAEFELERDPLLRGLALFWESSRGATPALAPGALSQLGLLGLVYTFRHPALRRASSVPTAGPTVNSPERT